MKIQTTTQMFKSSSHAGPEVRTLVVVAATAAAAAAAAAAVVVGD